VCDCKFALLFERRGTVPELITGATGFLGSRMLRELLTRDSSDSIAVLGRGEAGELRARVERALDWLTGDPLPPGALDRLRYVSADLTRPRLGLGEDECAQLTDGLTTVWHSAALLALRGGPAPVHRTNVLGTRTILDLAESAPDARLVHVSTAYVAGNRASGHIMEDDLSDTDDFASRYEESKYTAEQMIRGWAEKHGRTVLVARTGLLIDDRAAPEGVPPQPLDVLARIVDGVVRERATKDRVVSRVLAGAAAVRGTVSFRLRGNPDGELSVLQADYAARAIVRAAGAHRGPGLRTVHVTHPRNTPLRAFVEACEATNPFLRLTLTPEIKRPTPDERRAAEQTAYLVSASAHRRTFDRANLLELVGDLPEPAPVDVDYLIRTLGSVKPDKPRG
jgi:dihydroflavonol-4-reductase